MKDLLEMLMMDRGEGYEEMDPREMQAKMEVLKELFEMAMAKSGEDVANGMSKMTVMAPDKEGLMEGMEHAEDMMESDEMPGDEMMPEGMSDDEEDEEEDY